MKPKAVINICGGWLQVPSIEAAHRLGLKCIVTDRNADAPAMKLGDAAVVVDIYDVPGHIRAADELKQTYDIIGCFAQGADCEVTVASLAAHLGLPGISVEAARRCKNKTEMRRAFAVTGVSPVWYSEVTYSNFSLRHDYPVMVKAVDNCGSRGTHRVNSPLSMAWAVMDATSNSTSGKALVEEYLTGPQQSVELLFDAAGRCHWLNIVDRLFADDGVMELGHVNPTGLPMPAQVALYQMAEQAAAAVGVAFGAFKCDTIWTDKGPRVLECTARLSGGLDCQYTTPAATGRDFITAAMRVACGLPFEQEDLTAKYNRFAAAWAAFPKPGRVKHYYTWDGPDHIFVRVKPGDIIEPYQNCAQRPAFVVMSSDTYVGALTDAKEAAATLEKFIVTEPV